MSVDRIVLTSRGWWRDAARPRPSKSYLRAALITASGVAISAGMVALVLGSSADIGYVKVDTTWRVAVRLRGGPWLIVAPRQCTVTSERQVEFRGGEQ